MRTPGISSQPRTRPAKKYLDAGGGAARGRCLTLRQADGCAGGVRAIVGLARRSRSLHRPLGVASVFKGTAFGEDSQKRFL